MISKNMLTTKESQIVGDLLIMEELAIKKSSLFARTLTNQKLTKVLKKLANNHRERFVRLYELLGE